MVGRRNGEGEMGKKRMRREERVAMVFDPVERAEEIEKAVMLKGKRRYYRFRYSRHYGGIVTADTLGCNLLCAYCWNYFRNLHPSKHGKLYSPEEVADKLLTIAGKKGINLFRISGAEPVLGRNSMDHLIRVIEDIESRINSRFILETNGLMLGYMPELADMLVGFNVAVRVAIKGWNEESFEKITNARGEYFPYQFKALKELRRREITSWAAVMYDAFGEKGLSELRRKMEESFSIGNIRIEAEHLERYPFVMENLRKKGLRI